MNEREENRRVLGRREQGELSWTRESGDECSRKEERENGEGEGRDMQTRRKRRRLAGCKQTGWRRDREEAEEKRERGRREEEEEESWSGTARDESLLWCRPPGAQSVRQPSRCLDTGLSLPQNDTETSPPSSLSLRSIIVLRIPECRQCLQPPTLYATLYAYPPSDAEAQGQFPRTHSAQASPDMLLSRLAKKRPRTGNFLGGSRSPLFATRGVVCMYPWNAWDVARYIRLFLAVLPSRANIDSHRVVFHPQPSLQQALAGLGAIRRWWSSHVFLPLRRCLVFGVFRIHHTIHPT
jgi:hypothetical protein